ncbi:MAG TPA: peptide ABC transporter substrate-binding protein [Anaerolineales bacterium]
MKKLRWPLLIAIIALAAISILLISQKPDTLQPIAAPVVQPAEGGIYSEGLVGTFMRLNPVLDYYNDADREVDRLLYSGMLRIDDRGLPQADLATSWGISRDGLIYNFSLNPNAAWHDGQPVTSDDVIFTIQMMSTDDSPLPTDIREFWKQIELVRLDEKTLQFKLPEPFAPFLDYLTFGILPSHLLGHLTLTDMVNDPFNLHPVGSGPYRFDHLITKDGQITGVVLSAFKEYYSQAAYIDQIAFRYYPDAASEYAAYQSGDVGGLGNVTAEILPQVLSEKGLNIYTTRLPTMTLVLLNLDDPQATFFQDVNVRKALMQGLNRQWMIDSLIKGQAILADGPIFPGTWAYYDGIEHYAYNPNQAIELLRQAGFTIPASGGEVRTNEDGTALSFELVYPDDHSHAALAKVIQSDWASIGVQVTLTALPYDQLVSEHLDTRDYQAALVDLNLSRSPDPDPYPFWHQAQITSGQNYSNWDDRQASEYLEQARISTDMAERTRLYNNFQVRWSQELPALPLYYPVYTYAVSSDVQGVSIGPIFDPSDRFTHVTNWYLVTRRAEGEATASPTP